MSFRANQIGGSGGLINFTGGNVYVGNNLGVGTSSPSTPITVSAASGDGVPLLRLTATSAPAAVNWLSSSINSSLTTSNATAVHLFGQAQSTNNSGYIGFRYTGGAGSASNHVSIGLYAADYLLNILGNGNVGIGNTAPGYKLEVTTAGGGYATAVTQQSDIGGCIAVTSNNSGASSRVGIVFRGSDTIGSAISSAREDSGTTWRTYMAFYTNNQTGSNVLGLQEKMRLNSDGYLGILTNAPAQALHVVGQIIATSEITAYYSDRRLKENVKPIDNAIEKVLSLNGITYTPNELAESFGFERNTDVVGLFADEVEAVLPQAVKLAPFDQTAEGVSKSGENYKTVQYEKVVPLLIEAIKEQQERIAQLEELVKQLVNK
jgi:hypothetical protein